MVELLSFLCLSLESEDTIPSHLSPLSCTVERLCVNPQCTPHPWRMLLPTCLKVSPPHSQLIHFSKCQLHSFRLKSLGIIPLLSHSPQLLHSRLTHVVLPQGLCSYSLYLECSPLCTLLTHPHSSYIDWSMCCLLPRCDKELALAACP